MRKAFLFSGQGSQYRGMGKWLFEHNPVFRDTIEQSDLQVRRLLNRSIIDELYGIQRSTFDELLITHPAIVAVEIAMYKVMQDMGITPDYCSGNSLGEFAAAVASGVWSAETAIEASVEQAKAIVKNNRGGGMLAVIHKRTKDMELLYRKHDLVLASDNFDGQFTLAGTIQNLDLFKSGLIDRGIQFLVLPVAFPFHSPLINDARDDFVYYLSGISSLSSPPPIFVPGIMPEEAGELPVNYFWNVVSEYTDFPATVRYIESKGPCLYIDLGPSGTSASFVKYNLSPASSSQTFQIMTPFKGEGQRLKILRDLLDP